VEPSLRFAPLNLILFIWWSTFGFQLDKSFTYQLGINPAYPDQEATPVKGDFDKIEKQLFQCKLEQDMIFHFQRMQTKHNLYYLLLSLSNLILVKIHVQQKHGTIRLRAGVALKFGQGKTFKKLLISKQTNKFRFL
jgi:hypothetical protein